ncbi:MAG: amino acid racemase, partial [Gammaproteobacteria bacterium]|nr:amino acid racemase [Gammaproteobacteria bacterium]
MSSQNKIVGVLGGMGPDATVDFMAKVISLTPADKDQDHVHMLVDHNPQVPDRQSAILADGENPGPELAAMASRLERAGADFLVIACNTAYAFEDAIVNAIDIPLISIIDVTVAAALEQDPAAVGVLATDGCLGAGMFQIALDRVGVESVLPSDAELSKLMDLIYRIKAGFQGERVGRRMTALAMALVERGADAIIGGCTEIPLVLDQSALDVP